MDNPVARALALAPPLSRFTSPAARFTEPIGSGRRLEDVTDSSSTPTTGQNPTVNPDPRSADEQATRAPGSLAPLSTSIDPASIAEAKRLRTEFTRFMMQYQFAIDEVLTKISILQDEFTHLHSYNPIEHVNSRVKSPESIIDKVARKGCDPSFEAIRSTITDIAGVRITCSFIADTYRVLEMLTAQSDITVREIKDYIAEPKANGYKSLHAIIEIPVFMSNGVVPVLVELQIRTIAMDFWASLEHKIYYKYSGEVPGHLVSTLTGTAQIASELDRRMEHLHAEVRALDSETDPWGDDSPTAPEPPLPEAIVTQLQELRRRGGTQQV
ncbi:putative GTP pyrophosphokinase [Labedella gwakjiensis]|uniref:GTP pyrophosphokinase family protein n=1 Tax=Labedella gwakjiensis TaxID=390269 RepID=A0A2P8GS93_9MICO|nr:putative GTP pyrophosphokinase [Labedella gwakjiensis]RUQ84340.1 GTP pyrophosphokinase family protein [Labedella gwakjiensis]